MSYDQIHPLDEIVMAQKQGQAKGITSICSAHPVIIKTAFQQALKNDTHVLIESTCNQVNQFGGYTGMRPADFVIFVKEIANKAGFPWHRIILGGDHLGPNVWQDEPTLSAMTKSRQLVHDYVREGYCKIHLDPSMKLADDPPGKLPVETIAQRTAELAMVAEQSFAESMGETAPRYVIGTEVPIPGGMQETDEAFHVSEVETTQETLETTRQAFYNLCLESAWKRVIATVVQPGVEYGNDFVIDYDRKLTKSLSAFIEDQPFVYEAHSTDYQLQTALKEMVEDHFAILKVGPALTFAYRETIFGLAMIENELFPDEERSSIMDALNESMVNQPGYWQKHYHGSPSSQATARKYSFSDRSRYYWPQENVQQSVRKLHENFGKKPIPLSLLSQYLPKQYEQIRVDNLKNTSQAIVQAGVYLLLEVYQAAVTP
jgi:D-tagatose-1,6-bisphosphate aldolase subunit GatZ/KbaZ